MRSLKKTKNMTIPLVRPSLISFVYLLLFYCLSLASDHVVIVVMDGARYSETTGGTSNIPNIAALARQGTTLTNFRTFLPCPVHRLISETIPGHSRITTGTYQDLYNDGSMLPTSPSIFQYYRKEKRTDSSSCMILCSKNKLNILGNTSDPSWSGKYLPAVDCGSYGIRDDSITHALAIEYILRERPSLMLINYAGPDEMGHLGDWNGYIEKIKKTDDFIGEIWHAIQNDTVLRNSTTLFITNDHGRHTDDFYSHGDDCEGCTHIMFVAIGPDIKINHRSAVPRESIDIAPTISYLAGFNMPGAEGKIMHEIFKNAPIVIDDIIKRPVFDNRVIFNNLPAGTLVECFSLSGKRSAPGYIVEQEGSSDLNRISVKNRATGIYLYRIRNR